MANITCPQCSRFVDDSAKFCPGCKYNIKKYVKEMKKKGGTVSGSISFGSVYSKTSAGTDAIPELEFLKPAAPEKPQPAYEEPEIMTYEPEPAPAAPAYQEPAPAPAPAPYAAPAPAAPSYDEVNVREEVIERGVSQVDPASLFPRDSAVPSFRPAYKPRVAASAPAYDPNYKKSAVSEAAPAYEEPVAAAPAAPVPAAPAAPAYQPAAPVTPVPVAPAAPVAAPPVAAVPVTPVPAAPVTPVPAYQPAAPAVPAYQPATPVTPVPAAPVTPVPAAPAAAIPASAAAAASIPPEALLYQQPAPAYQPAAPAVPAYQPAVPAYQPAAPAAPAYQQAASVPLNRVTSYQAARPVQSSAPASYQQVASGRTQPIPAVEGMFESAALNYGVSGGGAISGDVTGPTILEKLRAEEEEKKANASIFESPNLRAAERELKNGTRQPAGGLHGEISFDNFVPEERGSFGKASAYQIQQAAYVAAGANGGQSSVPPYAVQPGAGPGGMSYQMSASAAPSSPAYAPQASMPAYAAAPGAGAGAAQGGVPAFAAGPGMGNPYAPTNGAIPYITQTPAGSANPILGGGAPNPMLAGPGANPLLGGGT